MDGPPADIWYSQHAQTRCLLLVTSEATNFGKVFRFQHFIRPPVHGIYGGFSGIFRPKNKMPKNKKSSFFGPKTKTKFGGPLAPYIIIYNKYGMSHLLLCSTTILLSRWWESIPMGIGVIPILILIDSHSHFHCLFNFCPISMGFPFPCTSLCGGL